MSLLLAALCLFDAHVTVQMRAQPLSLLLPTLGAKLGRKLTSHPSLEREWIAIDAKDVDADALLERIAFVTHAQWLREDHSMRLQRSEETERALRKAEDEYHTANLTRQWRAVVAAPYDPREVARKRREATDRGESPMGLPPRPVFRYLYELLLTLPVDEIGNLEDGRGFVLSNRPIGIQRPFPASSASVLDRLFRDQEAFATASANEKSPPVHVPTRAVLRLAIYRPDPEILQLLLELKLYDPTGEEVAHATGMPFSLSPPPKGFEDNGKPIEFSPTAQGIERLFERQREDTNGENRPFATEPLAVREAMLNPERDGRLRHTWSDVAFSLASRASLPIVANFTEKTETGYFIEADTVPSLGAYVGLLTNTEIIEQEGWMTLRPRLPGIAGATRGDRATIGQLLRTLSRGYGVSLEESARIQPKIRHSIANVRRLSGIVDPTDRLAPTAINADEKGLAILRLLGPNLRSVLESGHPISFAAMPLALQTWFRKFYGESGHDDFDLGIPNWPDKITSANIDRLTLQAEVNRDPTFVIQLFPDRPTRRASTAKHLAQTLGGDLRPRPSSDGEDPETMRFQTHPSRTLFLTILFPTGDGHTIGLSEVLTDPTRPFLLFRDLPPATHRLLRRLHTESNFDTEWVEPDDLIQATNQEYKESAMFPKSDTMEEWLQLPRLCSRERRQRQPNRAKSSPAARPF